MVKFYWNYGYCNDTFNTWKYYCLKQLGSCPFNKLEFMSIALIDIRLFDILDKISPILLSVNNFLIKKLSKDTKKY